MQRRGAEVATARVDVLQHVLGVEGDGDRGALVHRDDDGVRPVLGERTESIHANCARFALTVAAFTSNIVGCASRPEAAITSASGS